MCNGLANPRFYYGKYVLTPERLTQLYIHKKPIVNGFLIVFFKNILMMLIGKTNNDLVHSGSGRNLVKKLS